MHAEIIVGDSIIMASEPMKEYASMPATIFLYVKDCDTIYEKAIKNGAESIMSPTDMKQVGERYGGEKTF